MYNPESPSAAECRAEIRPDPESGGEPIPTLAEIKERAAIERALHLAKMKASPGPESPSPLYQEATDVRVRVGGRSYSYAYAKF